MLEKDPKAPRQHPYLTRHPSRRPAAGPEPDERAWQAQARLYHPVQAAMTRLAAAPAT